MARRTSAVLVAVILLAFTCAIASAQQQIPGLAGRWSLDRALSEFPAEIGFGTPGALVPRQESEQDAKRLQQLIAEVRTPPARLAIVQTGSALTITDDRDQTRAFHADGRPGVGHKPLDSSLVV
jgi:hypothetical protein